MAFGSQRKAEENEKITESVCAGGFSRLSGVSTVFVKTGASRCFRPALRE